MGLGWKGLQAHGRQDPRIRGYPDRNKMEKSLIRRSFFQPLGLATAAALLLCGGSSLYAEPSPGEQWHEGDSARPTLQAAIQAVIAAAPESPRARAFRALLAWE